MAHSVNINQDTATLTLSGEIDLQVSGDIKSEIERLSDVTRLDIDASEVSYIDSSGVAVLILARQFCAQNNMTLELPSISEAVHRVLQIAKLDVMLPIGKVVSAPQAEEFSFGDGSDTFGDDSLDSALGDALGTGDNGGDNGGGSPESDDDLVNSLLSDDTGFSDDTVLSNDTGEPAPAGAADAADNDEGGVAFEGLDVNAVDFSEPAAAPTSDAEDQAADFLPDGDALKPGTFS